MDLYKNIFIRSIYTSFHAKEVQTGVGADFTSEDDSLSSRELHRSLCFVCTKKEEFIVKHEIFQGCYKHENIHNKMSSTNAQIPDLIGMMKAAVDNDIAEIRKKLSQIRLEKLQIQQLLFVVAQPSQENIFL
nr:hypothetical protein [Marseillevirus cajuinensis]